MSTEKRVVLPNGKVITVSPKDPKTFDPNKITAKLVKEVPNDTRGTRLNKRVHKIKRRAPRGMQGTSNRAGAAYAGTDKEGEAPGTGMERLLFQIKFLPRFNPNKILPHPPTTTRPTYDVDTFGLKRSAPTIER